MATRKDYDAIAELLRREHLFAQKAFSDPAMKCSALDAAELIIDAITHGLAEHFEKCYVNFDLKRFIDASQLEEEEIG